MKIKIKGNVIHTGRILKKDAVHEVDDDDAKMLISGGHAVKAAAGDTPEPLPAGKSPPAPAASNGKKRGGSETGEEAAGGPEDETPADGTKKGKDPADKK